MDMPGASANVTVLDPEDVVLSTLGNSVDDSETVAPRAVVSE